MIQARANKSTPGDLQKKLDAQKRQTQNQTLQQAADENLRARQADQASEARNYNWVWHYATRTALDAK